MRRGSRHKNLEKSTEEANNKREALLTPRKIVSIVADEDKKKSEDWNTHKNS